MYRIMGHNDIHRHEKACGCSTQDSRCTCGHSSEPADGHTHSHGHKEENGHSHGHTEGSTGETVIRIIVSAVLLAIAAVVERVTDLAAWQLLLLYLLPYLAAGLDTLKEAWEGISHGEALDENFLMAVATIGALCIGFLPGAEPQFAEAVFVMLFFQVGELFEGIAAGRSRKSISSLMDIRPDTANLIEGDSVRTVHPSELSVGDLILVRPGEKLPVDGVVVEGASSLDTVALTGESVPRGVSAGDPVFSGCVNLSGVLKVRTAKDFGQSTASKILDLVENASRSKSRSERFITSFARVYTPAVVAAAVLLALVPPIFAGWASFPVWLYRALVFLIVSCPCALVLSVPLAFFGGIGGASRRGVLVKGSNYLEALSKVGTVVFDKTGTLTHGVFEVTAVHPAELPEKELLHLAAHVERYSTHPIAASLRSAYPEEDDDCTVTDVREVAGEGVEAMVNGHLVSVGNARLMDNIGARAKSCHRTGTIVHVAIDHQYAGHIVISDRLKDDSVQAVSDLGSLGVRRTVMLTGDHEAVAAAVAKEVGVSEYHASLLPADKVAQVERLLKEGEGVLAFVGDGINDAPVLARADVGIAMGALGSDAAIEAADVVLMDDRPSKIAQVIGIARKTVKIARQNTVFAIGVKMAVLVLASFGLTGMWLAVFADVGVTVLAVLNSMRTLR